MMLAVVHPGMVDLGKIVVFGSQPKYRDRVNSLSSQPLSQPYGRQRFVNGVGRAGKKTNLLAGDYGNGSGPGQAIEKWMVAVLFP